jgi:hypothetical protein
MQQPNASRGTPRNATDLVQPQIHNTSHLAFLTTSASATLSHERPAIRAYTAQYQAITNTKDITVYKTRYHHMNSNYSISVRRETASAHEKTPHITNKHILVTSRSIGE